MLALLIPPADTCCRLRCAVEGNELTLPLMLGVVPHRFNTYPLVFDDRARGGGYHHIGNEVWNVHGIHQKTAHTLETR
jgi:hypothetical protein